MSKSDQIRKMLTANPEATNEEIVAKVHCSKSLPLMIRKEGSRTKERALALANGQSTKNEWTHLAKVFGHKRVIMVRFDEAAGEFDILHWTKVKAF